MTQRVLVVDDDQTVSDVIRRYLENDGFQVSLAADGAAALAAVERQAPHLVVLDLMLPRISGLEVCRALRVRPDGVPIVMLTARGDESDRILGLQLGADDYLTKPFSPGSWCCGSVRCSVAPALGRHPSGRRRSPTAIWWCTRPPGPPASPALTWL